MRLLITANNGWYEVGATVEVDDDRAAELLNSGSAEPAPEPRKATKPAGEAAVKPKPKSSPRRTRKE